MFKTTAYDINVCMQGVPGDRSGHIKDRYGSLAVTNVNHQDLGKELEPHP